MTGPQIGRASWRASWRIALRLARRHVRRGRGRTALIAAMVGIPVMLVVSLATLYHTNDVSPAEGLSATMGLSQAEITTNGAAREQITQSPDGQSWSSNAPADGTESSDVSGATAGSSSATQQPWTTPELEKVTGGRLIPNWIGSTRLAAGPIGLPMTAHELPTTDHQTTGMVDRKSGRLPTTANEIAVTPAVLATTGWKVGTVVHDIDTDASLTIVGTYLLPAESNHDRDVLGLPGSLHDADSESPTSYLLVRDRPVSWAEVQRLNQQGLVVASRQVIQHPPADRTLTAEQRQIVESDPATRAVLVLVIVSIVIEVILLAGPAFAVGVRRRVRELALLAATGSTPRDVRRTVLAEAALVGVGSAAVGAALGLPLAAASVPVIRHFGGGVGPFDWRLRELLLALAIGGLAAVLAALVPAISASRADVATVLAGRRGVLHSRRGWPLLGVVLIGAAAAVTLTRGTRPGGELWVAVGTIVLVLGGLAATPWLIGQVGRLATRLPLPLRLATRDAVRQRARTAPAVAAIMASVIGVTTLAIGFASDNAQSRRDYEPRSAPGLATIPLGGATPSRGITDAVDAVVPGRPLVMGYRVGEDGLTTGTVHYMTIAPPGCTAAQAMAAMNEPSDSCPSTWQQVNANEQFFVGDPATVQAFGLTLTGRARAVLAAGGVLVASPAALRGDHVLIATYSSDVDGSNQKIQRQESVPAALLPSSGPRTARVGVVVVSPLLTAALHLPTSPSQLAIGGAVLTTSQEDRINEKLTLLQSSLYVERGFHEPYGLILALLALVAGIVVLVGTVTATGLAMSEARPDLATLAAVGAPPRTRRYVAAAQSVVIGLLGTVIGVALGFVPGLAVTWPLTANSYSSYEPPVGGDTGPVIAIPWLMLAIVVIAVPVVAGVTTGLFTRSRLPLVRRMAT